MQYRIQNRPFSFFEKNIELNRKMVEEVFDFARNSNDPNGVIAELFNSCVGDRQRLLEVVLAQVYTSGAYVTDICEDKAILAAKNYLAVTDVHSIFGRETWNIQYNNVMHWLACTDANSYFITSSACRRFAQTKLSGVALADVNPPFAGFVLWLTEYNIFVSFSTNNIQEGANCTLMLHEKTPDGLWDFDIRSVLTPATIFEEDKIGDLNPEEAARITDVRRIVLNTIIFATNHPDRVLLQNQVYAKQRLLAKQMRNASGVELARLEKKAQKLPSSNVQRYNVIGYDMPDFAKRGEGDPLLVRTLVTGHWRNQPHGAGKTQRRLQWIEPFWRGPEDAPISTPVRVVI